MEHQGGLCLVGAGMEIDPGRAGYHLLEPGAIAYVGQGCDHSDLRHVQALISHRHGNQDGRLRS